MAQLLARGPAHLPIQSGDPRGTGCPSTQQAQWTDNGPSGHGGTAEKKNFKPGTILVPYQGTSSLTVLPAAQLIQQHTSPSLTQSQPETHHSSSSSPPPRHMTMHMHPPRAFNIQYSNIYDLKLTSQTLYHFNNAQAPTTCILQSLLQYFHHLVHVP